MIAWRNAVNSQNLSAYGNAELGTGAIFQMNWLKISVATRTTGNTNASAFTIDEIVVPVSSVVRNQSGGAPIWRLRPIRFMKTDKIPMTAIAAVSPRPNEK